MDYKGLTEELNYLLIGRWLTDFSNFCSFFYQEVSNINWIGFYLIDGDQLKLGPFMGKPACTDIKIGKGVCGTAFLENKSLIVDDVDQFEGHIVCDTDSKSELVIPVNINKNLIGVLDVDSSIKSRFSTIELELFEKAIKILVDKNSYLQSYPNIKIF